MGDKVTKTVKVPASMASDWDDYVEENGHVNSVSDLIRQSVNKMMSGKYDLQNRHSGDSASDSSVTSGEILTQLRKIETAIGDLEERVAAVENVEAAEANYDLQKATFNTLPEPPEKEIYEIPEPGESKGTNEQHVPQEHPPDFAVTADEIARQLGAEVEDVNDALDHLQTTTGQVRSVIDSSETVYYWRKGR